MRTLKGAAIVITLEIMAWILWKPAIKPCIRWAFTRVEVQTHPACKPRYWTTRNGVRTEGPWNV